MNTPQLKPNKFNLKTLDELIKFADIKSDIEEDGGEVSIDHFIGKSEHFNFMAEQSYYHAVYINPKEEEGKVQENLDKAIKLLECAKIWAENFGL